MADGDAMNDQEADRLAPELTDDDVYDAMGRLPRYLDITTNDFRALYRLAFAHAVERLVGGLSAKTLMRAELQTLLPEFTLGHAAQVMVRHGL